MIGNKRHGTCEVCGKPNRSLQQIDSGQWLCHTCLREVHPARTAENGSLNTIRRLQTAGYHIDDYASTTETERLAEIKRLRDDGAAVSETATPEEILAARFSITHIWHDKIAGVSRTQKIVDSLTTGDQLFPVRDPSNRYDPCAIKLLTTEGRQVGWIRADTNGSFAHDLDRGVYHEVFVSEITGADKPTHGVNITIVKHPHIKGPSDRPPAQSQRNIDAVGTRMDPDPPSDVRTTGLVASCGRLAGGCWHRLLNWWRFHGEIKEIEQEIAEANTRSHGGD